LHINCRGLYIMVSFKCLVSGTIVNFEHEHDIKDMRTHPQYLEVVVEEPKVVVKKTTATLIAPTKD
jgi:hypothetical protein